MFAGFADELEKIAAARGQMSIPKERQGRRPMTVDTLLRREKDGTLFKEKKADSQGNPQPVRGGADSDGAAPLPRRLGEVPGRPSMIPDSEKTGEIVPRAPKKLGDVPTQDDLNAVDRRDGRGEATTVVGLAQRSADIGVSNGEHA